ncbi:MAG: protein phosphatase 2C domain-containing protein, partial [Corynebacterium sp.]|nr:protein phosphatase 2C domain-containing protein [Corynebacterium sp.]
MSLALNYTARSDRGLIRQNNEDSAYAGSRLLALADGMGGHAAGEIASQLMIAAVSRLDNDQPGPDLLESLRSACMEGNNSIADEIEQNPSTQGMGTTLTALLFDGTRLGMCHVGDSRGYLLRDGELIRITRDETYVQSLV